MTLEQTYSTEVNSAATEAPALQMADAPAAEETQEQYFCAMPTVTERTFSPDVNPDRLELLLVQIKKWVNGTVLRYYFFDQSTDGRNVLLPNGTTEWRPWATSEAEKAVVREAFQLWKDVGIGISFKEVDTRDEAEIRIGFEREDGAWSYIGRDIIDIVPSRDARTMNFGWDLTRSAREMDTAVHEIGHTIGFPHEHQNPNAGIVWDEEAVYADLAAPPNRWKREKTFYNILRKLNVSEVRGSDWDPDSIMHYPFKAGLIKQPDRYRTTALQPAGGLSARDKAWIKTFYPPQDDASNPELKIAESFKLALAPSEQRNFVIHPTASRDYNIQTFGTSDTVMVLFEEVNGELRYLAGDDDSGEDRNAYIKVKLMSGRHYVLRVRLYYADRSSETAVMLW